MSSDRFESADEHIRSRVLFELFKQYERRQFVFVRPGGNFGDLLIYQGAEKLAHQAGIEFKTVSHPEFMSSDYNRDIVVYIHGGGGFNNWWSGTPMSILDKAVKTHRGVVISGPQTCSADLSFLENRIGGCFKNAVSEAIFVFARDKVSFSLLEKIVPQSVAMKLDHDTAMNVRITDLPREAASSRGRYLLYAIREDKEKVRVANKRYLSVWLDPVSYCRDFSHWLMMHAKAKAIVTNRIHSATLGSILGKPTTLLPNNYHKNRAIWEYSLKDQGVRWQDSLSATEVADSSIENNPLLRSLLRSSAVNTFLGWSYRILHGVL